VTIRIDCPQRGKDCFITINLNEWSMDFLEDEEESSDPEATKKEVKAEGT